MGFGKAIVALTAIEELLGAKAVTRVLVLAPLRVCELTWAAEPALWPHLDLTVGVACGDKAARTAVCESPAQVVVTNFENARWIVDNYGDTFDGLCVDEITKLKAAGGAAPRKLRHFTKRLKWRAGMTGTLVAEDALDLYTQALLIDLGKALGTRKETFMRTYFYPTNYAQTDWAPLPGSLEKIAQRLRHVVYCAEDGAYLDGLPEVRDQFRYPELSPALVRLYKAMDNTNVVEVLGQTITAPNQAVRTGKLHQLANGGLYGEDEDKRTVIEESQHKVNQLLAAMYEIRARGGQALVIYQYSFELQWLKLLYPDAPVLGAGSKVGADVIEQWNRGDGTVPVMIGHPRSMAHGLNIQFGGNDIIHLSPLWSADQWQQCLARLCRRGQPADHVNRWIFVSRGTIEEEMIERQEFKAARESHFMDLLRAAA